MVTIHEVANFTGTSIGTVSRALNGESGVSKATRAKIEAAANTLGYRSNAMARGLRRNSSNTIGLLIPDFEKRDYTAGAALLHDILRKAGYRLLLSCHYDDPVLDAEELRRFADFRVDGIIHSPCTVQGAEGVLGTTHGIPIVELFRQSQSTTADAVAASGELASFEMTDYLIQLNHRRIALITGQPHLSTSKLRIAGFKRAIASGGLDPACCPIVTEQVTPGWCRQTVDSIMQLTKSKRPTAIFASSSHLALDTLKYFLEAGVGVPEEMSVVGFSSAEWCAVSQPTLTSYEIPLREMGLMAGQLLLNRLQPQGRGNLQAQIVSFSGRIVIRDSALTRHRSRSKVR